MNCTKLKAETCSQFKTHLKFENSSFVLAEFLGVFFARSVIVDRHGALEMFNIIVIVIK